MLVTSNLILVMLCAIWYHLYNLKNVKNSHGRVLLLDQKQTRFNKNQSSVLLRIHGSPALYKKLDNLIKRYLHGLISGQTRLGNETIQQCLYVVFLSISGPLSSCGKKDLINRFPEKGKM